MAARTWAEGAVVRRVTFYSSIPSGTTLMKSLSLRRILLADDEPNDVELTLTALGERHLANAVDVVKNGAEALDYLFRRDQFETRPALNPALILLDIKMPKVDGLEVLRQIRADPSTRRIPVVMLTSSREEGDLLRSYELGVNAYVVKPVDFDHFMRAVSELGMFWAVINEPPPERATTADRIQG